jgi:hypothetical protein
MPGIYLLINLDETADAAIPYPPVQTFEKWLRRGLKFFYRLKYYVAQICLKSGN